MKKHLFSKLTMCLLSLTLFCFSCKQTNNSNKPSKTEQSGDPALGNPIKVMVYNAEVKMENWTAKLTHDKTTVATGNVKATFKIGDKTKELTPEVVGSPVSLREGVAVKISLKVPAQKGSWQEWKQDIYVTQSTQSGVSNLELASLSVNDQPVTPLSDLANLSIQLPSTVAEITKISGEFKLDGVTVNDVTLNISPNLPQQIEQDAEKTFSLSVAEKSGQYGAWNATLKVKRAKQQGGVSSLELVSLSVNDQPVTPLSDLANLSIQLPSTVAEITKITGEFKLNGTTANDVTLNISPNLPQQIEQNAEKTFTLSVAEKTGQYGAWNATLKVKRAKQQAEDPELTLTELTVCGVKAEKAVIGSTWNVNISDVETVNPTDVQATFKLKGQPVNNITLNVEGLPHTFAVDASKQVKCSVAAKPGEYKAWSCKLGITRIEKKPASNVSISVEADNNFVTLAEGDDGKVIETTSGTAIVGIFSSLDAVITKATIGGKEATLSSGSKYAEAEVGPAEKIEVVVEFKEHLTMKRWFKLVKKG